jgi:hypothetical protein
MKTVSSTSFGADTRTPRVRRTRNPKHPTLMPFAATGQAWGNVDFVDLMKAEAARAPKDAPIGAPVIPFASELELDGDIETSGGTLVATGVAENEQNPLNDPDLPQDPFAGVDGPEDAGDPKRAFKGSLVRRFLKRAVQFGNAALAAIFAAMESRYRPCSACSRASSGSNQRLCGHILRGVLLLAATPDAASQFAIAWLRSSGFSKPLISGVFRRWCQK